MKFSICIPNFNYERYLGRTIQSVLDQNDPDVEVLISDNASTDRSVDIVRGFADSRIRLRVNRCNVGFAGNLDRAAGMAEGTWMLMLSSDDLLRLGALACYRALFARLGDGAESVVVSAAVDVIDADEQTTGRVGLPKNQVWRESDRSRKLGAAGGGSVYRVEARELLRRCLLTMQNPFQFAATVYPRRLYEAVEGYGGNRLINPDKWFHWKLLAKAETAYFIDRPLAAYRWHATNQTAQQAGSGALKFLMDEYASTFELDSAVLQEVGLGREDVERAFVEHDLGRHAVTLLLHQILAARSDLRVLLLDVHNEYSRCFGERALVLNPSNIKLPFWLYNFDEIVDVLFGGRPSLDEEVDTLSECIPLAKSTYAQQAAANGRMNIRAGETGITRYTVDVPVPYRISDLIALLDARMGKLENRSSRMVYHKLITRIETACNDPRYAFMFENANVGGDTMVEILSTLFRLPANGVPVTILQLAGFPSEVVDAVVSVTCRMAFDLGLWSDGANPLLVLCEEAHRYMAADHSIGFAPTRRSISRIAKEGRKYGVFLGLVSQRPAELDSTILSQCSTLFAMRMTNDRDQALLRSAVADTAANFLSFLPSLGTGEAFAFGEGVALPTRLKFGQLPMQLLPKSETVSPGEDGDATDQHALSAVVDRWRGRTIRQRATLERATEETRPAKAAPEPQGPAQPQTIDPNRFKLLKRPLDQQIVSTGWNKVAEPHQR